MFPAYLIIYACYLLLAGTAVAAFDYIHDLYTLNFVPSADPGLRPGWFLLLAEYFLALYPVFALSSTFPVMGTTLANNLVVIFRAISPPGRRYREAIRWGVPLLALIPPIIIAVIVNDVGELVGITGAFAGSGIMYVLPSVLVFLARRALARRLETTSTQSTEETDALMNDESVSVSGAAPQSEPPVGVYNNPHRSPFAHTAWIVLMLVWAASCLIVVSLNKFGVF